MTRRRWLRTHWPFDMRTLAERLRSNPFTADTRNGFIIDRFRSDAIEGRFIERQEISQVIESPLGEKFNFQRTEFKNICFIFSEEPSYIEIINAPRSTSLFLSRLGEICDFLVSVEEIRIDVNDWYEKFARDIHLSVDIVSCQLKDIRISEGIIAEAVIKSNKDIRIASNAFLKDYSYTNDKLRIKIKSHNNSYIVLTRQASAVTDEDTSSDIFELLRKSLFSL